MEPFSVKTRFTGGFAEVNRGADQTARRSNVCFSLEPVIRSGWYNRAAKKTWGSDSESANKKSNRSTSAVNIKFGVNFPLTVSDSTDGIGIMRKSSQD